MDHPVPQIEAMEALGRFAAKVGTELDLTLPVKPVELVAEAISDFLGGKGDDDDQWSSLDMATAILDAVVMPEPEMVEACRVAVQAIRNGLPYCGGWAICDVALVPLETAIANFRRREDLATMGNDSEG